MRQRIYNALQSHYSGSALLRGMRLWEDDFAYRRRFSKQQFALMVSRQLKPSVDYSQVLMSIIKALSSDKESLLEVPEDFGIINNKPPSPEENTFTILLTAIGEAVRGLSDPLIFEALFEILKDNKLSPDLASALIKNLRQSKPSVLIRLKNTESYRTVINALYIGLCDIYGPVKSDKILSDAVKKTDLTAAGKLFAAGNFL